MHKDFKHLMALVVALGAIGYVVTAQPKAVSQGTGTGITTADVLKDVRYEIVKVDDFQVKDFERRLAGVQKQVTVLHTRDREMEQRVEMLEKKMTILIRMKAVEHSK